MGKGIVKLGEGQWATKDGKLLAAKETNGRFKNAEFTVTRGTDATYTDKDGLIKRVSAPRNRNTTSSNTLDLFVLAGQSNAMGWLGDASSYPPQEPNLLDSSIKLNYEQIGTSSKSDGWQTLGPQQRRNYGEIFGPEVTFSRLLKRGGYNPAIFKYTQGSTSLADDWRAPGQSGHYDTMVTKFNAAVLDLQNQGYTVNIAGFIWIQGEQDATDATDAGNYQSNLNAIISDFRTNVASNSTLEFVLGVDEGNPASNINTIVTAQTNIANGDANIVRSSMVGLEKADSTHLTPAGIIDHGKRIYDSMFDLASAEPRIDFTDNTDGHLLLEPESTNLLPYSEDFSDSSWVKNGFGNALSPVVTLDTDISPDGTQNASRIEMDCTSTSSSDYSAIYQQLALDGGSEYTISFYVKSNTSYNQDLLFFSNSSFSTQITAISEWQRVESTFTSNSTNPRNFGLLARGNVQQDVDILIWGAQLEALPYATSYIPSLTGSTVTRAAETLTGSGNSTLINSTEGVLYAEISGLVNGGVDRHIALSDGTSQNYVQLILHATANRIVYRVNSQNNLEVNIDNSTFSQSQFLKIACVYKQNDFSLWINGVERATDTSGSVPIGLNTLNFDFGQTSQPFYGKCKALAVFNEALSDAELNNLTG